MFNIFFFKSVALHSLAKQDADLHWILSTYACADMHNYRIMVQLIAA